MKKITLALTLILVALVGTNIPANALEVPRVEIEYLENGDYIETIITDFSTENLVSTFATNTKTGTKTKSYKNSAGTVLWTVTVKGTFSYNGSTAVCTSCSHSTTSPASSWTIKSSSHSKSGNTATAKATATHTTDAGTTDLTRSVSLQCSAYGVLS